MEQEQIYRFDHICKSFNGHSVLNDISCDVPKGSVCAITGPSGVGKTTLIRILLGLEEPDAGDIYIVSKQSPTTVSRESLTNPFPNMRTPIGVVFQENRLCEYDDAITNIRLINPKQISREMARGELAMLLPAEALADRRPVLEFSGGMKRRVAIVRACMAQSDLMVFDEPFTGLDEITLHKALSYIHAQQRGRTIFFTAHDADFLEKDFTNLIEMAL